MAIAENQPTKISVEGVFKVFGRQPAEAISALRGGASKTEILRDMNQVVAVHDANFSIGRGEIFVVMGLSGSGKSTIVRLMNRLIEPSAGRILIDDEDVTAMSWQDLVALRRRDIAMVFQSFALMPHLTNLENAAFGLDVSGTDPAERRDRAMQALQTVGLGSYADSYPDELSGGMQQRVGLARALALEPTVLLMDEAFSALDPLIRLDMQRELLRIRDARDLTVVFISHDLDEALRVGDRITIMDDGAVVQTGTAQELVSNPANDYVRTFFRRADMGQVFTAYDLARIDPAVVFRKPHITPAELSEKLQERAAGFGFVLDGGGGFEGIVSRASLDVVRQRKRRDIASAFLSDPILLDGEMSLDTCLAMVADAPYEVPVVGNDRAFLGTISKSRVLKTLSHGD